MRATPGFGVALGLGLFLSFPAAGGQVWSVTYADVCVGEGSFTLILSPCPDSQSGCASTVEGYPAEITDGHFSGPNPCAAFRVCVPTEAGPVWLSFTGCARTPGRASGDVCSSNCSSMGEWTAVLVGGENQPPVASFTRSPGNPLVGEQVVFDASPSHDADGVIAEYEWDLGDGATATERVVRHAYAAAGEYTVTLTVTDDDGLTDSTSRSVRVGQTVEQTPPRIEEITVTPQDPVTRHDVTFEARISEAPGFEVQTVDWVLRDAATGKVDFYRCGSNPYTTKPAAGTHGKKKVTCTIYYKNVSTGRTGVDLRPEEFLLFFSKYERVRSRNPLSQPNWFFYWKRDGAVPDMNVAEYDPNKGGYGYLAPSGQVYLCRKAAMYHYPEGVTLYNTHFGTPNETFGGPSVYGIDCAAEIVAHELYHREVRGFTGTDSDTWQGPTTTIDFDGLLWTYHPGDACHDGLPDIYEATTSHTDPNMPDTYNVCLARTHRTTYGHPYATYGDQEYMAMRAANEAKRGDPKKDWANPGKQTTVREFLVPSERKASSVVSLSQKSVPETRFTGTYSDHGTDTNGNGLYDYLTVTAGIDIATPGCYDLISSLSDTNGNTIGLVNEPHTFEAGTNEVELNFDGTVIHHFRVDGPYSLSLALTDDDGNEIRREDNAYLTFAYGYTGFEGEQIWFTGNYSDHPTDMDADGVYDYLTLEIETNTTIPGDYTIEGYLYDDSENPVVFASTPTYADIGTQTTQLNFDGLSIGLAGKDGPYTLRYLALQDGRDSPIDFVLDAYTTAAYNHTEFRRTDAAFGDMFSDHGLDTNGDGLLEFLLVEVPIDVTVGGNYTLAGYLYDLDSNEVLCGTSGCYLEAGLQSMAISFDGPGIFTHGLDGPYELRYVLLYDESGSLTDILGSPYTTSSYNYTDFQRPEASAFRVAGVGRLANGRLSLDFPTALGQTYYLEACDCVEIAAWAQTPFFDSEDGTESQQTIQGTGALVGIYVSATGKRAFYRVAGP
jgi:PKD repeat protein